MHHAFLWVLAAWVGMLSAEAMAQEQPLRVVATADGAILNSVHPSTPRRRNLRKDFRATQHHIRSSYVLSPTSGSLDCPMRASRASSMNLRAHAARSGVTRSRRSSRTSAPTSVSSSPTSPDLSRERRLARVSASNSSNTSSARSFCSISYRPNRTIRCTITKSYATNCAHTVVLSIRKTNTSFSPKAIWFPRKN